MTSKYNSQMLLIQWCLHVNNQNAMAFKIQNSVAVIFFHTRFYFSLFVHMGAVLHH